MSLDRLLGYVQTNTTGINRGDIRKRERRGKEERTMLDLILKVIGIALSLQLLTTFSI